MEQREAVAVTSIECAGFEEAKNTTRQKGVQPSRRAFGASGHRAVAAAITLFRDGALEVTCPQEESGACSIETPGNGNGVCEYYKKFGQGEEEKGSTDL
jgi:hypothetical protein